MTRTNPIDALRVAAASTARAAADHRKLVLSIPELAARLTRPPLDYATAEQWNGSIPPFMVPGPSGYVRNDSAQRVHLVALVRAAYAQTCGEDVARAWLEEANTDRWTPTWMPSPYDAMRRAADVLDRHTPDWAKEGTR